MIQFSSRKARAIDAPAREIHGDGILAIPLVMSAAFAVFILAALAF